VSSEKKIWFRTLCHTNGLMATEKQLDQLDQYINLLLDWNKKINLISRKDEENIWTYHILHSVSLLFKLNVMEGSRIVDIGSGGGLPGIPIKILRPDISLLCLDATRKKVNSVLHMVDELKLKNVHVVWGRAEELGIQSVYEHKFDFAIARAVCQLDELIALSINFLGTRNYSSTRKDTINKNLVDPNPPALIAFKGGNLKQELDQAMRHFSHVKINTIDLTFTGSEHLVASDKKILVVHL
jgi:16S rRNA (guanine(527)-N(7))-methyltransferase RsmG